MLKSYKTRTRMQDMFKTLPEHRRGFTLAEVLITIGIVGVVSAITIPTLIKNYQKKQTVVKLQKAVSILNQAYRMSFDEVGEPANDMTITAKKYFLTYWQPYLKGVTYCSSGILCGYKENAPATTLKGAYVNIFFSPIDNNRTMFMTPEGFIYLMFFPKASSSYSRRIFIDINGGASPNVFGKDLFVFYLNPSGKGIIPWGSSYNKGTMDTRCSEGSYLNACAEKIRRAGWKIDKTYPW